MDIGLPGENGIQPTQKISERFSDITTIVLSNYDTSEYESASLEAGVVVLMSKDASTHADIIKTTRKAMPEFV